MKYRFAKLLVLVLLGLALLSCETPTQPEEDDGSFERRPAYLEFRNFTLYPVGGFYISPADSPDWGTNLLSGFVIWQNDTYRFTEIPPGTYKVRADLSSGPTETTTVTLEPAAGYQWTLYQ